MRRFLAGLVCGAGALFVFRWRLLRRLRKPEVAAPDPADELKRKLEASRAADTPSPEPEPESAPEPEPPPEAGLDERRRGVHDRGRAAIDRMRGDPPPD